MALVTAPRIKSWRNTAKDYIDKMLTGLIVHLSLLAQNANIATATLFTPLQSATYRVAVYIIETTIDGVSSTLPSVTIGWTDPDNSTAQTFALTASQATDALTNFKQATMLINAKAGVAITYSTGSYASNTANKMQYALKITLEML